MDPDPGIENGRPVDRCKDIEELMRQAVAVIAAFNAKWATKGGDDEPVRADCR